MRQVPGGGGDWRGHELYGFCTYQCQPPLECGQVHQLLGLADLWSDNSGWRITDHAVKQKTAEIARLGEQIELERVTVVLQSYDNSVFLVGGAGSTRHLPVHDSNGIYHMDGELVLADKAGVKDLSGKMVPLIRALNGEKSSFYLHSLDTGWTLATKTPSTCATTERRATWRCWAVPLLH